MKNIKNYYTRLKENLLIYSIAIILIVVIVQSIRILFNYNQGILGTGVAGLFLNWAGVIATVALALGIFKQALQNSELLDLNEDLAQSSNQRTLISQEAEWIPDFRQPMQSNWLLFSDNRPWYPWFNVEIEDEGESGWDDEIVYLVQDDDYYESVEEYRELRWHEKQDRELDDERIDRYIPFPNAVLEYIEGLDNGFHKGKLYFRFETMTEEEYFFIFHIHILVHPDLEPHGFEIKRTPDVERIMPWFESEKRDELKEELDPIIEESKSLDQVKDQYPQKFVKQLEAEKEDNEGVSNEFEIEKE